MRVIKPGRKDDMREHEVTCAYPRCAAVIAVRKMELRFTSDQREGYAYVMKCPECGKDTWIDARRLI